MRIGKFQWIRVAGRWEVVEVFEDDAEVFFTGLFKPWSFEELKECGAQWGPKLVPPTLKNEIKHSSDNTISTPAPQSVTDSRVLETVEEEGVKVYRDPDGKGQSKIFCQPKPLK